MNNDSNSVTAELCNKIIGDRDAFIQKAAESYKAGDAEGYLEFLIERMRTLFEETASLKTTEMQELLCYLAIELELDVEENLIEAGIPGDLIRNQEILRQAFDFSQIERISAKAIVDRIFTELNTGDVSYAASTVEIIFGENDERAKEEIASYADKPYQEYLAAYPKEADTLFATTRKAIAEELIALSQELAEQPEIATKLTTAGDWLAATEPRYPCSLPEEILDPTREFLGQNAEKPETEIRHFPGAGSQP